MKKIILVFLSVLSICNYSFSQEATANERKWAVKAYVNGSYTVFDDIVNTSEDGSIINTYSRSETSVGKFSPAISYTKGKLMQELEFTDFSFNKVDDTNVDDFPSQGIIIPISGSKRKQTRLSLRYLASGVFRPFKSKKISLGIGGSAQPYFFRFKEIPATSASFPYKSYRLGVSIAAVPQIEYDFFKRFFINLSSPIEIFDISLLSYGFENPIVPISERQTKEGNADFFPKRYNLRMGLGVRF